MNKTLTEIILGLMDHATPQAPMRHAELVTHITRARPEVTPDEISDHLETLIDGRQVSTCRITRGLVSQNVYWPTGLKSPALAGIKPKEPIAVPHQDKPNETLSSKLIKVIVAHGPLLADDLAEKSGVSKNNIGGNIQHAIKTGSITTRKAYVPERGREMTHYMTTTQAQEWDARGDQIEVTAAQEPADEPHAGHVMNHPLALEAAASVALDGDTRYADDATLARLDVLEREHHEFFDNWHSERRHAEALATQIHDLKNDLAARNLILHTLADKLQVDQIDAIPDALDELTHALATRSMTGTAPEGRLALLLIDSADLIEVEELDQYDSGNAQELAVRSIEQGHAKRAVVVRIIGEATRKVEWKEAD